MNRLSVRIVGLCLLCAFAGTTNLAAQSESDSESGRGLDSLMFGLSLTGPLEPYIGAIVTAVWQPSSRFGFRLGVDAQGLLELRRDADSDGVQTGSGSDTWSFGLGVRADLLAFSVRSSALRAFVGPGVHLSGHLMGNIGNAWAAQEYSFRLGVPLGLGVEWPLTPSVSLVFESGAEPYLAYEYRPETILLAGQHTWLLGVEPLDLRLGVRLAL